MDRAGLNEIFKEGVSTGTRMQSFPLNLVYHRCSVNIGVNASIREATAIYRQGVCIGQGGEDHLSELRKSPVACLR